MSNNSAIYAIDIGHCRTKGAHVASGKALQFPSVVCSGGVGATLLSLSEQESGPRRPLVIRSSRFLVSDDAHIFGDVSAAADTSAADWAGSMPWLACLYSMLFDLGVQRSGEVCLALGLPYRAYTLFGQEVQRKMQGKHAFIAAGHDHALDIKVHIFPTAASVYFDLASADETLLAKPVGLIDIGGTTTDFVFFGPGDSGPEMDARRCGTLEVAVSDILDKLQDYLLNDHDIILERFDLIEALERKWVLQRGERIALSSIIGQLVRTIGNRIYNEIMKRWGDLTWKDGVIYVFGGGAEILGEAVRSVFPYGFKVENGAFASVRGLSFLLDELEQGES